MLSRLEKKEAVFGSHVFPQVTIIHRLHCQTFSSELLSAEEAVLKETVDMSIVGNILRNHTWKHIFHLVILFIFLLLQAPQIEFYSPLL